MTVFGFWLSRLSLRGPSVPTAEVTFKPGLNVVSGPSDTGKTFMVQCIDFALGAKDLPKEIPEATGYDLVSVSLRSFSSDKEYTLERSLRGGHIRLLQSEGEQTLAGKHQPGRTDTISFFLLELSGLSGRKVHTNQRGKTRELSFRDVARLAVIDEETIITERSPIVSGQFTSRTVKAAVFRLLLTGVDDSAVIAAADPRLVRGRIDAKIELLDELTLHTRAQLEELDLQDDREAVLASLEKIEVSFAQASLELQEEQGSVAAIEAERREVWTHLRQVQSRLDVLGELKRRFELLRQQYLSDIRRLDSISETSVRLGQLKEDHCPVCGASAEHHDAAHRQPHNAPEEVALACQAEAQKLHALLADLENTTSETKGEVEGLESDRNSWQHKLEAIGNEIQTRLEPRVHAALTKLRESQAQRDKLRRASEIFDRIEELDGFRAAAIGPNQPSSEPSVATSVGAAEVELLSQEVERLLRLWHFPELDRVTYSEDDQDVIISGRRRSSHGKGVRAITHAAFILGLLRYCRTKTLPHPGLVVIDSPLVVYREPDADENGFTPDVKDAFYRVLAEQFSDSQVIIFENENPPEAVQTVANLVTFTGTVQGRQGFLPKQSTPIRL